MIYILNLGARFRKKIVGLFLRLKQICKSRCTYLLFQLRAESHSENGVKLEIDNLTILPDVDINRMLSFGKPSKTIIVPEAHVEVKKHPLSHPSCNTIEQSKYESHTFRAPELMLEHLQDHYWFPESGFLISRQGKVWRHSVLGQYGDPNFITTEAIQERKNDDGSIDLIFNEGLLKGAKVINEPCIITSHYASHNYGHFMLDMVPLIQLGLNLGLKMLSRPLLEWQKPIYLRVGVDPNCLSICNERVLFLKNFFVSNRHNAEGTYAASPNNRKVFEKIFKNIPHINQTKHLSRIFLSRGTARSRQLSNRTDLENMLIKHEFNIISPEELTFDDQAILFSQADIIVSEFGALMANVVFCRPETKIIEIIPEDQNDPWSVHLCASMGLNHVVVFHKVKDEDREAFEIAGRVHKNIFFKFAADIDRLESILTKIQA